MSDLLSLLSLGSAGIAAQNTGVSVASNNVANVNTEGYSRQRVDLEALPDVPLVGGVRSLDPQRFADNLLAGRIRLAGSSLAMARTTADALSDLESRLEDGGPTLSDQMASLFARFGEAASSPTDPISRRAIVTSAQSLVDGIHRRAGDLATQRTELNTRVRETAGQATDLARRLADANVAYAKTGDPAAADDRDRIAKQLSELVGGSARIDGDGQMRFVLDGGAVLVDGQRADALVASPDPTTGDTRLAVGDRDVTAAIRGGTIGGQLAVRDGTLATAQSALDKLAYDLAQRTNGVHAANAGLDGVTGRTFFTPLASATGAASALAIDPAITSDPSKIALGAAGAGAGSNAGALAIYQLAGSFSDAAVAIAGDVGSAVATATADVKRDQLVSDHLAGLRDSLAGVDVQEELTNLARFQHASSAMTKFVATINDLLGELIDRL